MIPSLPTELLRSILEQVEGEQDRANCCSTSKSFLHIARPLLYATIRFFTVDFMEGHDYGVTFSIIDLFDRSSWRLVLTLSGRSYLQSLVHRIVWTSYKSGSVGVNKGSQISKPGFDQKLSSLIIDLSSLKEIVLEDPLSVDQVDEFVFSFQELQPSSPRDPATVSVHLIRQRSLNEDTGAYRLRASYTSLEFRDDSAFYTNAACNLLESSLPTLRSLNIPFDETALLPDYPHLRHLELIFALPHSSWISIAQELYESLPKLPALETLVLSDSIQPDLPTPFPTEPLSYSLPPTLTSLSLEGHFIPSDLSGFIGTLPQSSKLARLNVKGNEEESLSEGELEVECGKRGIRLTFDEVWEKKI